MKRSLYAAAILASATLSQADSLNLDLDYLISGTTPGAGNVTWGSLSLVDDPGGFVTATFSFVGGSADEFVTGLYLNTDKTLAATYLTPSVADYTGIVTNPPPLGGVSFDYELSFQNTGGPGSNRLTPGETVSFTLSDGLGTLSVADFKKFATFPGSDPTKEKIVAGMKIQGISPTGSAEIGAHLDPVPEPMTITALSVGLAATLRKRRKTRV